MSETQPEIEQLQRTHSTLWKDNHSLQSNNIRSELLTQILHNLAQSEELTIASELKQELHKRKRKKQQYR